MDDAKPSAQTVVAHVGIPGDHGRSMDTSGMLGGLGDLYGSGNGHHFCELEINRSDLPPDVLQPHETPETTPDIENREFAVLVRQSPETTGLEPALQPDDAVRDAWKMREDFFALDEDILAMRQFLNRWGLWEYGQPFARGTLRPYPFAIVFPHRLWLQRQRFIAAAAGNPRSWLSTATPLSMREIDNPPYFMVERFYCEDAIKATLTIDHLANVKFGICKRHDCRRLFKRATAQKRLYCSPECAHLANVRKLRASQRKLKTTGKGTKKNAKG